MYVSCLVFMKNPAFFHFVHMTGFVNESFEVNQRFCFVFSIVHGSRRFRIGEYMNSL